MKRMITFVLLLPVCLGNRADIAVSQGSKDDVPPQQISSSVFSRRQPVREGELLFLKDQMKEADSLIKDSVKETYANVKEMLKAGDSRLKEQLADSVDTLRDQLKEGNGLLKEALAEDATWLQDKLKKTETRMEEELAEGNAKTKEDLQDVKDSAQDLRRAMKEWTERNTAVINELQQQMVQVLARVNRSALALQMTNDELRSTQMELQVHQNSLQSTRDSLQSARIETNSTQEKLRVALNQLQTEVQEQGDVLNQGKVAQDQLRSLNATLHTLLNSPRRADNMERSVHTNLGSTFIRWGRLSCPENSSMIYSGVVGGSSYDHTGGSSNYLCLVANPQPDKNTTVDTVTFIFGAEYEHLIGNHEQDAVCTACRTTHATTIMVPATHTCPQGWVVQYRGHLVSGHYTHKRGTEYICMDLDLESRYGGHENKNGALFYYVIAKCGSLPCPPYVNGDTVTCVVCSA